MRCRDVVDRLDGYLDGELSEIQAQRVRRHLDLCRLCARREEQALALAASIRADVPYYRLPDAARGRIRLAVRSQRDPGRPRRSERTRWLALAASLVIGLAGGWLLGLRHGALGEGVGVPTDVIESHVRSLMADHLTDIASSDRHTVKPWFNGRLDFSPSVGDLTDQGFPLIGGRLDYIGGRAVAALAYSRRRHIINLFTWPTREADDGPLLSLPGRQGYALLHWRQGGMTYWAVSDLNTEELRQFVSLIERLDSSTSAH